MIRAFLSHSSTDKSFVKAVAQNLERPHRIIDEEAFRSGEEFRNEISSKIDSSSIFVFFASEQSLKSSWVNYELDEAWYKKLFDETQKILVYIIDRSISNSDIPLAFRRSRIVPYPDSPQEVARDIQMHIDKLYRSQNQYFVGRAKEREKLQRMLTFPENNYSYPRCVFLTGLLGIGRRTLLNKVVPDTLSLHHLITIEVESGDRLPDMCIKLAAQVEPYLSVQELKEIQDELSYKNDEELFNYISNKLKVILNRTNEACVFVDKGGMIDADGYLYSYIEKVIRVLSDEEQLPSFFVAERVPKMRSGNYIQVTIVQPLNEEETKILLLNMAKKDDVQISSEDLSELIKYVAGWPPAARYVIEQVGFYGIDAVLAEKKRLVHFRTGQFLRKIKDKISDQYSKQVLGILAFYEGLPFEIIVKALGVTRSEVSETLYYLVDMSLVIQEENWYKLTAPVVEAIMDIYDSPSKNVHRVIISELKALLDRNGKTDTAESKYSTFQLCRVITRAIIYSEDGKISLDFPHLLSDLIRAAKKLYQEHEYSKSTELTLMILSHTSASNDEGLRGYLVRGLVHMEDYKKAEKHLRDWQKWGTTRIVFYNWGFYWRKREMMDKAIDAFEKALDFGRNDVSVMRELAHCYMIKGQAESPEYYRKAKEYIDQALMKERKSKTRNTGSHVLDLAAQIAINSNSESDAREAIARLSQVDKRFASHRSSVLGWRLGNYPKALQYARQAVDTEKQCPVEILIQNVKCEIHAENLPKAKKLLDRLDKICKNTRSDIRTSLRCRLLLVTGDSKTVLKTLDSIHKTETYYYYSLKKEALESELKNNYSLDSTIRMKYRDEIKEINEKLQKLPPDFSCEEFHDVESVEFDIE